MLAKYILFILLYFAFTKSFAQAADGLRLNVRLYPVQMLAVGTGFSDEGNESSFREVQSVMISSPSGFQLNAQYDEYLGTIGNTDTNRERSEEYHLISHHKGVVQKRYIIDHELEDAIKNLSSNTNYEQNFLILTLISQ
ncbi:MULTISPECIES: hypothetical protein [Chryseobacterium]|uniref:Uncharacterized protein n=1 Tax=Chryseobacterium candidae TaxID=1978493 RepID=A0ABY2R8M9_9FLAO|nr:MULTISPECIES: hypothetical protein [Chryseobacterium]PXW16523.1 hypothetical protein C8D70_10320 [Chryseobacterium sp. CBTAP 102]THV59856.1 hypothetical protein EK417_10425 [Chryseobacterium candidae]SIQ49400.1 hypothetical protein SAMN05880573_10611 [Chryseobacterium sp. RU33C]